MEEDEALYEIERNLVEELLKRENKDTNKEVKKEIAALLKSVGFNVKDPGESLQPNPNGKEQTDSDLKPKKKRKKKDPLPTKPYPEVTYLEIVYPSDILEAPLGKSCLVRIETDANFRFDRENRVNIRSKPRLLEISSNSMLDGGRKYWRLRTTENAKVGDTGQIIASITKPDGSQLESLLNFKITEPLKSNAKKNKGLVPSFEIIPIDPYEDINTFHTIWPDIILKN